MVVYFFTAATTEARTAVNASFTGGISNTAVNRWLLPLPVLQPQARFALACARREVLLRDFKLGTRKSGIRVGLPKRRNGGTPPPHEERLYPFNESHNGSRFSFSSAFSRYLSSAEGPLQPALGFVHVA